jgi:O-methyltransferase
MLNPLSLLRSRGKPSPEEPQGCLVPTRGNSVSLPQRGYNICKPLYLKEQLQQQFHEFKDETFWSILPEVHDFTQLTMESIWSLYEAVRYIVLTGIQGDFVECGVFFGGASMLIAKTLLSLEDVSRELWLYDSFEGFVGKQAPDDVTWYGDSINSVLNDFYSISLANMNSVGYPLDRIRLVKGDIEETSLDGPLRDIALLRLDTDTYHSTKAELEQFYPRLVRGGVVIIDDYGHAFGARRATDEYFSDPARRVLLHRVNFTNRIGIKVKS